MDNIIITVIDRADKEIDLSVPVDISASELIAALYKGFEIKGELPSAVIADNPPVLLTGGRKLSSYGLRDGSRILLKKEVTE